MSAKHKDVIGDPFAQVAESGVLGKKPGTRQEEADEQLLPTTRIKATTSAGQRVKRTIVLPPALAKWLRKQAAEEEREMSEIVEDALELYRQQRS